jgi:hypothetical protein
VAAPAALAEGLVFSHEVDASVVQKQFSDASVAAPLPNAVSTANELDEASRVAACDCSVCTVLTVWGFPSFENMFYGGDPFPVCGCGLCSCVRNFTGRISRTIDSMQNDDARGCGDLFRGEYISAVGLALGEGVALCANRQFWDLLSHDGLVEILAGLFASNMENLSDILRVAPLAQRPGLFTNSVKHMADFTTGALQQVWDQAVRAGSSDAL